ncbi:MAG TPA: hypothetical protein VFP20_03900 [Bacteroidales bacterium]|nr:hypothetical protein [Bacteroidales bacterium]
MKVFFKIMAFFVVALLASCDGYVTSIPDREVDFQRNFNTSKLDYFGAYMYITQPSLASDRIGFGGLLIYHAQDNVIYAVDLACPKEVNANIRVSPPDELGMCKCATCGEVFDMFYGQGTPTKGIAKEPLRHYTVSFGDTDIIISR